MVVLSIFLKVYYWDWFFIEKNIIEYKWKGGFMLMFLMYLIWFYFKMYFCYIDINVIIYNDVE